MALLQWLEIINIRAAENGGIATIKLQNLFRFTNGREEGHEWTRIGDANFVRVPCVTSLVFFVRLLIVQF